MPDPATNTVLVAANTLIEEEDAERIEKAGVEAVKIRSVLTCDARVGVCGHCYGRDLARGTPVNIGEAVGVIAAQSIGEPGTQLTMRTFHIGGAAQRGAEQSSVEASHEGTVAVRNRNVVQNIQGVPVVMSRNCEIVLQDDKERERARFRVPYGARLLVDDGATVTRLQKLAEWDPYTLPIITERAGSVEYLDLIDGVTLVERMDEVTGLTSKVVVDYKQAAKGVDLRPRLQLKDEKGEVLKLPNGAEARYFLSPDSILSVENGAVVHAGDVLARIPREGSKTRDITGGLPRVAELFEARRPKDHAIIAESDGRVEFGKDYKAKRRIIVKNDESGEETEYLVPKGKHVSVQEGDFVRRGDPLVDGPRVPHDILKVLGVEALSDYLVNEIQDVYRLQGVKINDKHIEVIVRQMLQKVEILDPGDTTYLTGETGGPLGVRGGERQAPRGERASGAGDAGAAGHHQGQPADALLHQRGLLPGDHARADRGGHGRQGGHADGAEGERHRGPPDPGRDGRHDEQAEGRGRGPRPEAAGRGAGDRPRRRVARRTAGKGGRHAGAGPFFCPAGGRAAGSSARPGLCPGPARVPGTLDPPSGASRSADGGPGARPLVGSKGNALGRRRQRRTRPPPPAVAAPRETRFRPA